ncbi:MAG: RNA polymerase sigma factor [Saprospiraceae bacterium]|nr:RNA polymerase sigma factor [Saprospiraceae bacterium]
MSKVSETEIINGCQKGDQKSQRQLYDQYAPGLYAVCLRYAKNEQDAQDILQESFIRIFKYMSSYQAKGSFEGWLKKIVVNVALKFYKRFYYSNENSELDPNISHLAIDTDVIDFISEKELLSIIATLPEILRFVFNLHVIEGYSHAEISQILSIEESTSRTYLLRARKKLIFKLEGLKTLQ